MKMSQKPNIKQALAVLLTSAFALGIVAKSNAAGVTVTDVTDWSTTPEEVVTIDTPYLGYDGGAYAGINDLSVSINGGAATVNDGFCIDPFHFSDTGPQPYSIVPLTSGAPKAPGTLNAYTATEIEDLWAEYFSPTMSSSSAAGLQVAIWMLVSSNAVATGELTNKDAVTFSGNTYGATTDLASLATFHGTPADLEALTGPGQDYVIAVPTNNVHHNVPDNGATLIMLALTCGVLAASRKLLIAKAGEPGKSQVRVPSASTL